MGSHYWGRVSRRAWADTLRALGLDTAEKVVARLLPAVVGVIVVWFLLGSADTGLSIFARAVAALAVLLVVPGMFVWKLITTPSTLDAELSAQLKVETNEATRQKALDDIAEEIAWAIDNLINPKPYPTSTGDTEADFILLQTKTDDWCIKVSGKLTDRSIFTAGDRVHFDKLGSVPFVQKYGHGKLDWLNSMIILKVQRLREIEERARTR